ncbi:MAG: hypothetical protein OXI02_02460 [Candidatus Dadabacteria bacterium]|nr:hypothetical protein [Candidatus Dadabacteria bacterium]MDE0476915.1 hypothetical protein [Candidatus Dadabacteria bacterium]
MVNYTKRWKTLFVFFLIFSLGGTQISLAGTASDEKIKKLEEQIKVLADEIEAIKSASVTEPTVYETEFGLAPAASKVYRVDQGISFGGYGEVLIGNVKEGDANDVVDTLRLVLYNGYKYNDHIIFNSEIEFEHGTTGSNKDGQSGSASVEFAYVDFLIRDELNLRGGLLLTPFGVVNEIHEPTTFYGVGRPEVERRIIPSTWRESGAGAHGTFDLGSGGELSYRAYVMSSADARGFKASDNRSLRIKGNRARFEDMAFVGRLEYDPIPGIRIGGSMYYGNTGQDEEVNGQTIDGLFQMYSVDGQFQYAGLDLKALAVWTSLDDAALINQLKEYEGNKSVGEEQSGWYILGAYNIFSALNSGSRYMEYLAPFFRYEQFDTQEKVPAGYERNPANDRTQYTIGINYKPIPNVVIKAEYQNLDTAAGQAKDQYNFGIGYVF